MENKFKLSCESTVDLSYEYLYKKDISIIYYTYIIENEIKTDIMQKDSLKVREFYDKLKHGILARTSQISEFSYYDYFDKLLKESNVLHICLSSGVTSSFNNALKAKELLTKKYPNRKLIIIDSLCGSVGYGMMVDICAEMMEKGKNIKEIENWIIKNRNRIHHIFFSINNKFLKRSGRVSGPTAFISNSFGMCSILRFNSNGKIISYGKCLGIKRTIKRLIETVSRNCQNGVDYNGKMIICHASMAKYAEMLKKLIENKYINLSGKIMVTEIGPVTGAHCGPGVVGITFLGSEREK